MDAGSRDAVTPPSRLNPAAAPYRPQTYTPSPLNFAPAGNSYYNSNLNSGLTINNSQFPRNYHDFDNFVVIDFEATCDKEKVANPEIIEFPSVIVNGRNGQLDGDCFQTYVRPTNNNVLTDYCKDLTGIHQTQVDKGVSLNEALVTHDKWLEKKGIKNSNFAVVTWGDWDCRTMLESECRYKNIPKPSYFNRWINLKIPYIEVFGGTKGTNLKEAMKKAGLAWEGREHCGLDDAKNTARLLSLIMQMGFKLSFTGQLHHDESMCEGYHLNTRDKG